MPKPAPLPKRLSQKTARRLLEQEGWVMTFGGKHMKMEKPGHRPITLPMFKRAAYPPGLSAAILRQAGLRGDSEEGEGA